VKLTIYRKMMLGFGLIIAAMVALNAYILYTLYSVTSSFERTFSVNIRSIDLGKSLRSLVDDEEQLGEKLLVSRDTTYASLLSDAVTRFTRRLDSLDAVLTTEPDRVDLRELTFSHRALVEVALFPRSVRGTEPAVVLADTAQAARSSLDGIIVRNQNAVDASFAALQDSVSDTYNIAFLLTLGTIVITILLAFFIARTITRPIQILRRGTERIAAGRFEPITVTSHDEMATLAAAFNLMSAKLRQTEEYKADMMHHIAHELRVPLQSLYSAHYLLNKQAPTPLPPEHHRVLEMIRENVDRISTFINEFLDLAKMEAGKMEFRLEPLNLEAITRQATDTLRLVAERKQVRLLSEMNPVPTVMADRDKMLQVVINLLSNAVKYTGKGGTVRILLEPTAAGVRILVRDTGIGIDADEIPHLFTKFFQARSAGKVTVKGTGIGLALVKGIVEGHGGSVSVESTLGHGSTFAVELPVNGGALPGTVPPPTKKEGTL
jgi:signal transduction histidine kinase